MHKLRRRAGKHRRGPDLPPRPPLPSVPRERVRQYEGENDIHTPPAQKRRRLPWPIRAIIRMVLLACILLLGYWLWHQPFAEPVVSVTEALIRRVFEAARNLLRGE